MTLYHSGYGAMYSNGNVTVNDFDAWLVMPPINLPNADSIVFSFFVRPQYISNFYVLVSPSGDLWYDGFTDTLYIDRSTGYNTQWDSVALSLDAYRGRHIRVAFVHAGYNTLSNVAIDDVAISCGEIQIADTVWRTVTLNCDNTMGSVSGDGVYPDNSLVAISATAYEGFRFLGWSDGNANASRLLLLVSDTTIIASFQWVEDTTTEGIDNYQLSTLNSQLTIFPNPAHREVTISVSEPSTITILDMTGRTITPPTQSTAVGCSDTRLMDVSNLTPGVYFVRVATAKGVLVRKLIVK